MRKSLIKSVREYLYIEDTHLWFGVSLTLKQRLQNEHLDELRCSQNLRHFLNVFNKRVLGNSFYRYGKRVEVISVLERSKNDRLHYHLALKNPFPDNPEKTEHLITEIWIQSHWGYEEIHIDRNIDNGWIDYITKDFGDDSIDWVNCHLVR